MHRLKPYECRAISGLPNYSPRCELVKNTYESAPPSQVLSFQINIKNIKCYIDNCIRPLKLIVCYEARAMFGILFSQWTVEEVRFVRCDRNILVILVNIDKKTIVNRPLCVSWSSEAWNVPPVENPTFSPGERKTRKNLSETAARGKQKDKEAVSRRIPSVFAIPLSKVVLPGRARAVIDCINFPVCHRAHVDEKRSRKKGRDEGALL